MPTIVRPSGVTVQGGDALVVRAAQTVRVRQLEDVTAGKLDLVDAIPLATTPTRTETARRRGARAGAGPATAGDIHITVPVGPRESAVILLERDSAHEWLVDGDEEPGSRSLRFTVAAAATAPLVAYVFRFTPRAERVVTLRCTQPASGALVEIRQSTAPWVVVERPTYEGGQPVVYHYAHPTSLALEWLDRARTDADATVFEAFELRETRKSRVARAGHDVTPVALDPGQSPVILEYHGGSAYRTVVLDSQGDAVDVIDAVESQAMMSGAEPPASDGEVLESLPSTAARRRRSRGAATPPPSAPPTPRSAPVPRGGAIPPPPPPPAATPPAATPSSRPASATKTVDCHFRAETDAEYVVQHTHTVAVTIAREVLQATAGRATAGGSAKVKASKPLIVECMPMLRVAMVDPDDARVRIPVPEPGTPVNLQFDLIALEIGDAEVRVQVRQGPLPLVTLTLRPSIAAARSGAPHPCRDEGDVESMPSTFPRAVDELRVIQMRPTGSSTQYRYELRLPSKRIQRAFESKVLDTDPAEYIATIHRNIEDRWTQFRSEQAAFMRDLRAIGEEMFEALFPLELRLLLWAHRDTIGSVQVLSSEPFVPWELVYVSDPNDRRSTGAFLGELGVVRWLVSNYPPETLRLRKGKARYVVPAYPQPDTLPAAEDEIAMVTDRFGATAVSAEAEAIYRLVETPGQFDLLHIACHGEANSADIGTARLRMPGRRRSDGSMSEEDVMARTIARSADLVDGDHQPIVVLNACQSGRAGYTLDGIGGFAQAFVDRGAGVFIGSSWSVGDGAALSFIEEFYARFLSDDAPEPLAQAAVAARRKAREEGDATWLAYVVYGHPRARVKRMTT